MPLANVAVWLLLLLPFHQEAYGGDPHCVVHLLVRGAEFSPQNRGTFSRPVSAHTAEYEAKTPEVSATALVLEAQYLIQSAINI